MNITEILDREGLVIAPAKRRIAAFVIDDVIISLVIFLALSEQILSLNGDLVAINEKISQFFVYIIALRIAYQTLFTALYGGSVGKILCKIKIVRLDVLDKPRPAQAFVRSVVRVASEILLYIPLLYAFSDPFRRALHDILVQTIVIDVSVPQDVPKDSLGRRFAPRDLGDSQDSNASQDSADSRWDSPDSPDSRPQRDSHDSRRPKTPNDSQDS